MKGWWVRRWCCKLNWFWYNTRRNWHDKNLITTDCGGMSFRIDWIHFNLTCCGDAAEDADGASRLRVEMDGWIVRRGCGLWERLSLFLYLTGCMNVSDVAIEPSFIVLYRYSPSEWNGECCLSAFAHFSRSLRTHVAIHWAAVLLLNGDESCCLKF